VQHPAAAQALATQAASGGEPFGAGGNNDYFLALPLLAWVRFAQWDEILAAPIPPGRSTFGKAIWHWARGAAYARGGEAPAAAGALAALEAHEPPPWPQSLNLELGAALLAAGRPAEAERAFRADLQEFPANGWALYGLGSVDI
jgi:predicted Zn-dependent protease